MTNKIITVLNLLKKIRRPLLSIFVEMSTEILEELFQVYCKVSGGII